MKRPPYRLWFRLRWPREVEPEAALAFLEQLAGALGRGGLVLEAGATRARIEHRLGVPDTVEEQVIRSVRAALPGLHLEALSEPAQRPELSRAWLVKFSTHRRALRTDIAQQLGRGLLAVLADLHRGEEVVLQWLLGPRLRAVAIPNRFNDFTHESWWQRILAAPLGAPGPVDVEVRNALRAKQSTVGWRACLRIGARAPTKARQIQLLRQVAGALRVAEGPGVKLTIRATKPSRVSACKRPLRWPLVINVQELVGLLAWPLGDTAFPKIERIGHRPLPPSGRIPSKGRVVIDATAAGHDRPLCLNPPDALSHLHLLGPTGTGKSTLALGMALQDARDGRGLVIIEPKGDLIKDFMRRVPNERLGDVVLLDPLDEAPVGLNPIATHGRAPELVADQLLSVFHGLYAEHWGPRTADILSASLLTLAGTPGMTLTALPLLLANAGFRRRIVGKLAEDPLGLGSFWAWYESVSDAEKAAASAPVMNKLRAFLMKPTLRDIIGQARPRFDLGQVFTERRILLVNLAKGRVGPETAALLGSLVLSQLWQAILERSSIDAERRHPVFVYLDEFQTYLHLPVDLADALAMARGMGVGLILAHQSLMQLSPNMRNSVLANARSRVCFQLGSEDAAIVARNERTLKPEDFQGLGAYEVYTSLVADAERTSWASGRTRPASEPVRSAESVAAMSRERWSVPRAEVEAAIRQLTEFSGQPQRIGSRPRRANPGTRNSDE